MISKPFVFLIVCLLIWGAYIYGVTSTKKEEPVPPASDMERWDDLNNLVARDRFCQAMGYSESRIYEDAGFGGHWEYKYAGNPYGYDILCKGSVPTSQIYDYNSYKRWLLSFEIRNKTTEK